MKMYSYATSSVCNVWRCTWGLLLYLLKIMSPHIYSVMGERTWIKFAELIHVDLCQRSLRVDWGHPQSPSCSPCKNPFNPLTNNYWAPTMWHFLFFFLGTRELVKSLGGKAKQIHTIQRGKHFPAGKYRLSSEHTWRKHLPRHLISE